MTTSPLIVLERAVTVHRLLDAAGIPHAIGGALALAFHVHEARATRDIDLNVTLAGADAIRLFRLLPRGVAWGDADVTAAADAGQVRLLWAVEGARPIPLDLFFAEHERYHALVADRAQRVPLLGQLVPVLRATDLVVFKTLYARRKDWADIEELLRYGEVDMVDALAWLGEFVGPDDARVATLREIATEVAG